MELIAVHNAPCDHKGDIKTQCCEILNDEWPRSETLRLRSLNSSRDDLPMCLALVQWFDNDTKNEKSKKPCVLGHVRLAKITSKAESVWIESVVLHPDLRGKGFGKYLMLIIEKFAREEKGFSEAYLSTIDRQIFYSRCGYSFSDPVCAYSGNIKLPSGLTSSQPKMEWDETQIPQSTSNSADSKVKTIKASHKNQEKTHPFSKKDSGLDDKAEKYKPKDCQTRDIQSTSSNKVIPNISINSEDVTDLSVLCAKLYCRPSLPSNPPEHLKCPLRSLAKNDNDKINKTSKNEICRAIVPKDYMKKKL